MENPITSVRIEGNTLEVRESDRLVSEFSESDTIISVEFKGLKLSSSASFRGERSSNYTFDSYSVIVGKPVKSSKFTVKEYNSLVREVAVLNSDNLDLQNRITSMVEEIDNLKTALEEAKSSPDEPDTSDKEKALMEEIDRLKADIVTLTNKNNNESADKDDELNEDEYKE